MIIACCCWNFPTVIGAPYTLIYFHANYLVWPVLFRVTKVKRRGWVALAPFGNASACSVISLDQHTWFIFSYNLLNQIFCSRILELCCSVLGEGSLLCRYSGGVILFSFILTQIEVLRPEVVVHCKAYWGNVIMVLCYINKTLFWFEISSFHHLCSVSYHWFSDFL